jgi:DNA-binding PadR family transcriptional regulator
MGRGDDLSETAALVLLSLADGPRHGTAIVQDVAATSGRLLSTGTLYGTLDRLIGDGLIESAAPSGRRRPYRITPSGTAALGLYLSRIRSVLQVGTRRLAFE